MNKKNDSLYNTISERLKKYRPHLDKIVKKREKSDSFKIILRTENFHDHWPLQYRYHEFDFLKGKTKREKDKVILMYGIKSLIEFEQDIEKSKVTQPYKLYLFFDNSDCFSKEDILLWPYVYFSKDKRYFFGSFFLTKAISGYAKYIEGLLEDLGVLFYFNIFDYKLDVESDDITVILDFKENMNKGKINVVELLKVRKNKES